MTEQRALVRKSKSIVALKMITYSLTVPSVRRAALRLESPHPLAYL
ncbi:hypothetical protein GA0004734_00015430 [Rhizobium sp. 9140]|nr:hypothetical protein GA0004734_00015430 [Rhizobium sp. 9140]